ncbi:MAG: hypothetical protein LBR31_08900 [Desulfovibrio sp.]|jgi:hypothetical protein|nr:hypothetical protein [Desulfovibrio sp.]
MGISKRLLPLCFIFICTFVMLVGCRKTVPVENINSPMPMAAQSVNKAKIADAIIQGGMVTGWQITPTSDGIMTGILHIRNHTAVVAITYDDKSYRIDYKDSVNLKYKDGNIHPYYNGWVHNLDKNIRARLDSIR